MEKTMKIFIGYIVCLLCVSCCWVGLEYTLEKTVHSSYVDGIIAVILSYFITDKYIKKLIS